MVVAPTGFEPVKSGRQTSAVLVADHAATMTESRPCSLRVRRTVISTSWPRLVRNCIRRSTDNVPARLRISAETCGRRR